MQDQERKAFAFACIDKVKQSGISKLVIQDGTFSLTIENGSVSAAAAAAPTVSAAQTAEETEQELDGRIIPAPLVGTFYAAAAPEQPPIVKAGDSIKKGDLLCIIEAMKVMNNIESPCDGKITRVLAANGDMVEYNQPLFVIEETT